MSDFFSGIYAGVHPPDVVMNQGPLPPTSSSGMPPGFGGTPDAKIDYSSTLLGDLDPYAYGGPGRLSTQAAYLNIPHVAQRIVPQLNLPEAHPTSRGGSFMNVNHQVDDGDIGFIARAMFSPYDLVSDKKKYNRQGILYAIDPVMNLATTNYVLHGLQRYGFDKAGAKNWHSLWMAFGIDEYFTGLDGRELSKTMMDLKRKIDAFASIEPGAAQTADKLGERMSSILEMRHHRRRLAEYVIRSVITPFGIPRGSEKQGGQHQGIVNRSVTNPVDFVTAMVIDGKAINLANFWRQEDISAGDDLMLYLADKPYTSYTLSHNPRSRIAVQFEPLERWEVPKGLVVEKAGGTFGERKISDQGSRAFERIWNLISEVSAGTNLQGTRERMIADGRPDPPNKPDASQILASWGGSSGSRIAKREAVREIGLATSYAVDTQKFEDWVNNSQRSVANGRNVKLSASDKGRIISEMRRLNEEWSGSGRARKMSGASSSIVEDVQVIAVDECIFQLIPGVSSSPNNNVKDAVWKKGYWHIARSQVMQFQYDQHQDIPNGAVAATSGKLLEVTFSPVWIEPLEADSMSGVSSTPATSMALVDEYDTAHPYMKRPRGPVKQAFDIAPSFGYLDAIIAKAEAAVAAVANSNRLLIYTAERSNGGGRRSLFSEIKKAVSIASDQQILLSSPQMYDVGLLAGGNAYDFTTAIGNASPVATAAAQGIAAGPSSQAIEKARDDLVNAARSQWSMYLGEGVQGNDTTATGLNHNLVRAAAYSFMPCIAKGTAAAAAGSNTANFLAETIKVDVGDYSILDSFNAAPYLEIKNFPNLINTARIDAALSFYQRDVPARTAAIAFHNILCGDPSDAATDYATLELVRDVCDQVKGDLRVIPANVTDPTEIHCRLAFALTATLPLLNILTDANNRDGAYTIDVPVGATVKDAYNAAGAVAKRIVDATIADKVVASLAGARWDRNRSIDLAQRYDPTDVPNFTDGAGLIPPPGPWLVARIQTLCRISFNCAVDFANKSSDPTSGIIDPGGIFASAIALNVVSAFLKSNIQDGADPVGAPLAVSLDRKVRTLQARLALAPKIHEAIFNYIMQMPDPYETAYLDLRRLLVVAAFVAQGVLIDLSRVNSGTLSTAADDTYTQAMIDAATSPVVFGELFRLGETYAEAMMDDLNTSAQAFALPGLREWTNETLHGGISLPDQFAGNVILDIFDQLSNQLRAPPASAYLPHQLFLSLYEDFSFSERSDPRGTGRPALFTASEIPTNSSDKDDDTMMMMDTSNTTPAAAPTTAKKSSKKKKSSSSSTTAATTPFGILSESLSVSTGAEDTVMEEEGDESPSSTSAAAGRGGGDRDSGSSNSGGFKRVTGVTKKL